MIVKWDDIVAECGGYKSGFVAVFRKYEGQETDERDAYGRSVKVTVTSFARRVGIPVSTFQAWEKEPDTGSKFGYAETEEEANAKRARVEAKFIKGLGPVRVVDHIMATGEKTQSAIYDELKLRRAGIDNSPAARKAAKARTAEEVAPIFKAVEHLDVHSVVLALRDATESMAKVLAGNPTSADMEQIIAAHDEFMVQLAEASYLIP